ERAGDRADAEPLDQPQVHGASAEVDHRADRLHDRARDDVRRYRGERGNPEEEDQDRRHEGAATHSGEADHDADAEGGNSEQGINIHELTLYPSSRSGDSMISAARL